MPLTQLVLARFPPLSIAILRITSILSSLKMAHTSKAYVLDHKAANIKSHQWRTARNSAAFIIDSIHPGMHILDVGCGPGSITVDFAEMVPKGHVTGIEIGADILSQAQSLARERGLENVTFEEANVNALKYSDATFDLVFAHQVLQHLPEPVKALREMRRVAKPGGIVAVREGELGTSFAYPDLAGIRNTVELYVRVARDSGSHPDAGRELLSYALESGFTRSAITASASSFCFSSDDDRAMWGKTWSDRLQESSFKKRALDGGFANPTNLESYAKDWRDWMIRDNAIWAHLNGEILCRK